MKLVQVFKNIILLLILLIASFLRIDKIQNLMVFIGDQGWFYLSARNIFIENNIPLIGIASSRPWLHQGPFWTYLLAPILWIFDFNPVSGAYISIFFGLLSVLGVYLLGTTLFSRKVGFVSSLLYATSPLIVSHSRFPYHTSPIPLLAIIFIFSLYKIIKNKIIYFPLAVFLLSILYNFEIATIILWVPLIGILGYKLVKREIFLKDMLNKKIMPLSLISLITPLFPMILYDVKNGFPQTIKFSLWIIYRIASLFGYNPEQAISVKKIINMLNFLSDNFSKLIFASSDLVSNVIFLVMIGWLIHFISRRRKNSHSYYLIILLFCVPTLLIILNQTPSDAYLPILFPTTILLVSLCFDYIMKIKKLLIPMLIFITIMIFNNVYFILKNNFAFAINSNMFALDKRILISKKILNIVEDSDYNLRGKGEGSEFQSFTMNYEYLLWWLGHAPSKKNEKIKIYLSESKDGIKIEKLAEKK